MKKLLYGALIFHLLFAVSSPASDRGYSDDQIFRVMASHINLHFIMKANRISHFAGFVTDLDITSSLGIYSREFIKNNRLFLNYLAKRLLPLHQLRDQPGNAAKQQIFRIMVNENQNFRQTITDVFKRFLLTKKITLKNPGLSEIRTISMADAMALCIRVLYLDRSPDGSRILFTVRSGASPADAAKTEPQQEAFAYQTVITELRAASGFLKQKLSSFLDAAPESLSENDLVTLRVKFRQQMKSDPVFQASVLNAYKERAAYLPFQITGISPRPGGKR